MFNHFHLLIRRSWVAVLLVALGNLSGCATDAEIDAANGERDGRNSWEAATSTGVAIDSQWADRPVDEVLNDASSPLFQRVFYFGFDESAINPEDRAALTRHSEFLLSHPELAVTIEGHADERGSREYNLALGERRAMGVKRIFSLLGVAKSQQQVTSFGEEHPTSLEHNESGWRFNRRIELLYSGY